jgi:hypothetical protein
MDTAVDLGAKLFHGRDGFASRAHDFDTVAMVQLLSDGGFGQERLALHQAGDRICELSRHPDRRSRILRAAIRKIRSQRDRANQNKSREHVSFSETAELLEGTMRTNPPARGLTDPIIFSSRAVCFGLRAVAGPLATSRGDQERNR